MTTLSTIACALALVSSVINIFCAWRNHRRTLQIREEEAMIDAMLQDIVEMMFDTDEEQTETPSFTADGDSTTVRLKITLDDINPDTVEDPETRHFLMMRRLMQSFCLN